jgi:LysM repeat protein
MNSRGSLAILFAAVLAACQSAAYPASTFPAPDRWESATASPTPVFPTRAISLTPTIPPTPTPRTYTVRQGDTFGTIASKFGVTVDGLVRANPNVNPNALPIGQVLVIPAPGTGKETPQPSPTPAALDIETPSCYAQPGGGTWCLAIVANPGPDPVSSVFLRFSRYPAAAVDPTVSRETPLPVTVLPAGARTVAAVFFPPEESQEWMVRIELIGAIRTPEAPGHLPLAVLREDARRSAEGLELTVEFQIDPPDGAAANRLDAALVLLDSSGRPVGFRTYHGTGDWPSGTPQSLTLGAYLLAGEMESYEFILQARRVEAADATPTETP